MPCSCAWAAQWPEHRLANQWHMPCTISDEGYLYHIFPCSPFLDLHHYLQFLSKHPNRLSSWHCHATLFASSSLLSVSLICQKLWNLIQSFNSKSFHCFGWFQHPHVTSVVLRPSQFHLLTPLYFNHLLPLLLP